MRCPRHENVDFDDPLAFHQHMAGHICDLLTATEFNTQLLLEIKEIAMTESTDQQHLDADVDAMKTAFATVIAELKAQNAAGQPLDFTAADALVTTEQTEATADAPAAPVVPAQADGTPAA